MENYGGFSKHERQASVLTKIRQKNTEWAERHRNYIRDAFVIS
jgi:hypothetical protein